MMTNFNMYFNECVSSIMENKYVKYLNIGEKYLVIF